MFYFFSGPVAGLRAVRLLQDFLIDNKKMVAKVDAKNKVLLDKYQEEVSLKGKDIEESEKDEDTSVIEKINDILEEYKEEMNNFESEKEAKGNLLCDI